MKEIPPNRENQSLSKSALALLSLLATNPATANQNYKTLYDSTDKPKVIVTIDNPETERKILNYGWNIKSMGGKIQICRIADGKCGIFNISPKEDELRTGGIYEFKTIKTNTGETVVMCAEKKLVGDFLELNAYKFQPDPNSPNLFILPDNPISENDPLYKKCFPIDPQS